MKGYFKNSVKNICPKCGFIGGINKDHIDTAKCYLCGYHPVVVSLTSEQYFFLTPDERKEYDAFIREKYTLHSDVFDEELYKKTLEGDFERRLEIETEKREMQASSVNDTKPKCPTCQSTDIVSISGLERGASVLALGLFSKKINKSFKCNKCGYTW